MEKEPILINGTMYVQILPDVQRYLDIKVTKTIDEKTGKEKYKITPLKMMPDLSKHGKFIGVWNQEQQDREKEKGP